MFHRKDREDMTIYKLKVNENGNACNQVVNIFCHSDQSLGVE